MYFIIITRYFKHKTIKDNGVNTCVFIINLRNKTFLWQLKSLFTPS